MNLEIDPGAWLIFSLLTNAVLLITYVIFGPRAPRNGAEATKSLSDICQILKFDLIVINTEKDKPFNTDAFILSNPGVTKTLVSILNKGQEKIRSEKAAEG